MADKTVDNYITQLENWQAEIVSEVRQIILTAAPEADESIKWAHQPGRYQQAGFYGLCSASYQTKPHKR